MEITTELLTKAWRDSQVPSSGMRCKDKGLLLGIRGVWGISRISTAFITSISYTHRVQPPPKHRNREFTCHFKTFSGTPVQIAPRQIGHLLLLQQVALKGALRPPDRHGRAKRATTQPTQSLVRPSIPRRRRRRLQSSTPPNYHLYGWHWLLVEQTEWMLTGTIWRSIRRPVSYTRPSRRKDRQL